MSYERLSPQDSVFLHIEDAHQPMHVGALAYLEGGPFIGGDGRFKLDEAQRRIGSRLHLVPRFRKRIMEVAFDQGRPVWVDDTEFDLAYHVRLTALPRPGSEQQLLSLMAQLQGQQLDRARPLWEIWFVEGIGDGRVAFIQKTHHCLIDGMSGIDVATVLLDLEPDPPDIEPPPWSPDAAPDPAQLLVDSVVERVVEPVEAIRSARAALRGPQQVGERLGTMARAALDLGQGKPDTPLQAPITPHRRFELARVPLERAKAIKAAAGCTINDVVLAACTSALRDLLIGRDALDPGEILKAMVPVSVRADAEKMALGNRVSMLVADLPVAEPDPLERLELVRAHMASAKGSGQAVGAEDLVELTGFAPPTLLGMASRLAVRSMPVNLVITNVPGPQFPLYCMGARVLEAFPYVGILDNMALVIALISYDGHIGFGVTADRSALPDVEVVSEGIEAAFVEMADTLLLDQPLSSPMAAPTAESGTRAEKPVAPRKARPAKKKAAARKKKATAPKKAAARRDG